MKTRGILVAMVLLGFSAAFCQTEYDDVYFSRKDRNKRQSLEPKALKTFDKTTEDFPIIAKAHRTVDGYTGRTINPDYQSNYSTGTEVSSYFVPNYQPRVSGSGYSSMYANNTCYSCNNGWGMRNRIGFGMGWGYSPFYSGWGYSPYGYNNYWNMYDPYGYSGYNAWNSWGYGYPYSSWGSPYYGSGWGVGYGYAGFYGGWYSNNYYGSPSVNYPDNQVAHTYGKRSSRNSGVVNEGITSRSGQGVAGGQQGGTRGGRVATAGSTTSGSRYYQRGWRQDPNVNPSIVSNGSTGSRTRSSGWISGGSGNTGGGSRSSSWGDSNGGWGNSNWNNTGSFGGGGSRSSSFGSGGSGGSTGGGSHSGGGHSGGGTRGRN